MRNQGQKLALERAVSGGHKIDTTLTFPILCTLAAGNVQQRIERYGRCSTQVAAEHHSLRVYAWEGEYITGAVWDLSHFIAEEMQNMHFLLIRHIIRRHRSYCHDKTHT